MRAISMLLARPEITIRAILVSDGSLSPDEGIPKIGSLLREFKKDEITIARGDVLKGINPPWRQFNNQVSWSSKTGSYMTSQNAIDCLSEELRNTDEKIIIVCLGPLSNIAQFLKRNAGTSSKSRIERIVWFNESVKPLSGFNYECNKEAADLVLKSGVRIDVVSNLNNGNLLFDSEMLEICRQSKTHLGSVLDYVHSQQVVLEKLKQNHFRLSDDLVALYLTNPELFDINVTMDMLNVRYTVKYNPQGVKEAITDMINGIYVSEHNVVFNRFPVDRANYTYDVRQILDSAIARHGAEEWKANVMTDEFHGHLGVFSIVGAKMGIKARELFGVGPDMLNVVTSAGTRPPYSCLNDGIQVSTGATLGMGTISLAADSITRPSAVFSYKDRSIRISLKKEYFDKVDADINEGILKYGLLDDGYWKLIRSNALKYWVEWDRNKIFDIAELSRQD